MTVIKAAAVQLSPVLYSREGTLDKVCRQILALGREGVQFATFPETVVPYYPHFSFVQPPSRMGAEHHRLLEQAVTVPSAATQAIGEACEQAGMVVSVGVRRWHQISWSLCSRQSLKSRFSGRNRTTCLVPVTSSGSPATCPPTITPWPI